jgi:hypothetical protein
VLLVGAIVAGDQVVVSAAERERHERFGVEQERLGGLGAAIDPEKGPPRHRGILRRAGRGPAPAQDGESDAQVKPRERGYPHRFRFRFRPP